MGLISKIEAVQKITNLLKAIETRVTAIQNEADALNPSVDRIQADAHIIRILMADVFDIANSASEPVYTISFIFFGENMKLKEISMILADLVNMCNDLYMESLKESLKCY